MNKDSISPLVNLTADKLEKGEYKDLIPEIYALSSIVENIPWHLNQSVFNHLVRSVRAMENILNGDFINSLTSETSEIIKTYLNKKIDSLPVSEILKLTALLHDIGKDTTIKHFPDGSTKCVGHEAESASRVPKYAAIFGLSKSQEGLLQQLVANHDYCHQAVAKTLAGTSPEASITLLKQQVRDKYIAICLLSVADMRGGDLMSSNPQEFDKYQEIGKYFLEHSER